MRQAARGLLPAAKVLDQLPPILDRRAAARRWCGHTTFISLVAPQLSEGREAARSHEQFSREHAAGSSCSASRLPHRRGQAQAVRREPWMCGNRRPDAVSAAASRRPAPASRQALQGPPYRRAGCAGRDPLPRHPLCDGARPARPRRSRLPARSRSPRAPRAPPARAPASASAIGGPPPVSSHISRRRSAGQSPSRRVEHPRGARTSGTREPLGLLRRFDRHWRAAARGSRARPWCAASAPAAARATPSSVAFSAI